MCNKELAFDFQYEVDEAQARWKEQVERYHATGELPPGIESEEALYDSHRLFGDAVMSGRRLVSIVERTRVLLSCPWPTA